MNAQKITISDLPELIGTVEDTYMLPIDDGEITKKVSVSHFEEAASATARQYAEAAADSATAAAGSAHDAEQIATEIAGDISAATQAANDARGAATRAAGSADAAAAADVQAQRAASAASTSANTAAASATEASGYKDDAQAAANRAASWADYPGQTGSGSATNNAHYWADQAAAAIVGVATWNGRSGIVLPEDDDYNIDMMGDVNLPTTPSNNASLEYNGATSKWVEAPKKMNADGSNSAPEVYLRNTTSLKMSNVGFKNDGVSFGTALAKNGGMAYGVSDGAGIEEITVECNAADVGATAISLVSPGIIDSDCMGMPCYILDLPGCVGETGAVIYLEEPLTNAIPSGTTAIVTVHTDLTVAYNYVSFAHGRNVRAIGQYSEAGGYGSTAFGAASVANGIDSVATNECSVAEGKETSSSGIASHSEGYQTNASGNYSHAEGADTTANKEAAHAEGYRTTASGKHAHAEGTETTANNEDAHAEGYKTKASGKYAHAEGNGAFATGDQAHAEGVDTTASGIASHAEGQLSKASGAGSHAEGGLRGNTANTTAAGTIPITTTYFSVNRNSDVDAIISSNPGRNLTVTIDSGSAQETITDAEIGVIDATTARVWLYRRPDFSHSSGVAVKITVEMDNLASGDGSHAEGLGTTASGTAAHAEGYKTTASGDYSHAGGAGVTAARESQFAFGGLTKKFAGSSFATTGGAAFGFQTDGKNYSSNTTISDGKNGCSGTISGASTVVTIELETQGMYLLFDTYYTVSTGAVTGSHAKLIVAHGLATGTPVITAAAAQATYPTVAAAANNKITITNYQAAGVTQFSLIRIL